VKDRVFEAAYGMDRLATALSGLSWERSPPVLPAQPPVCRKRKTDHPGLFPGVPLSEFPVPHQILYRSAERGGAVRPGSPECEKNGVTLDLPPAEAVEQSL